ncbi:hypothetical protein FB451DRAFT_152300 [Mycena latifolia]|nr:hypothetical protein FB451DRAFT_152300 [Mycena latifolia]
MWSADLRNTMVLDIDIPQYEFPDIRADIEHSKKAVQRQLSDSVYPILTLPLEITSEIFLRCIPSHGSVLDATSASCAPMLLLRICRAWRVIALATPALWTDLNLPASWLDIHRWQRLETRISEWTSRASSAPLSFGFHDTEGLITPERMSSLLGRYASRLGSLRLRTTPTVLSELSDIGPLPLLHKLTLGYAPVHETISVRIFRDAPRLREVALEQSTVPSFLLLPWHQLTTFTADSASVADCLFVLKSAPRLTTCTFLYLLAGTGDREGITHGSLTDLSISNGAGDILEYLDLPRLRDLYLTRLAGFPLPAFLRLISRCATTVRRFHYYPAYRSRGAISVAWFRTMALLTEVNLSWVSETFQRDFLCMLNRQMDDSFLPHLHTLEMACEVYDVDQELVEALASRSTDSGGAKLASFRMILGADGVIEDDYLDELLELVAQGMKVHIGPSRDNYVSADRRSASSESPEF